MKLIKYIYSKMKMNVKGIVQFLWLSSAMAILASSPFITVWINQSISFYFLLFFIGLVDLFSLIFYINGGIDWIKRVKKDYNNFASNGQKETEGK
jgi:hypothetical protein